MYPARRHDGGGASRSGGARRTAGSKAPMRIDEVEMGRSSRQQQHARSSCLHGSAGLRCVAGPGRHHDGTRQGEIHLPPCNEDQVLMATAGGEPGTRRRRQPGDDVGEIPIYCATTTMVAGSIGSGA